MSSFYDVRPLNFDDCKRPDPTFYLGVVIALIVFMMTMYPRQPAMGPLNNMSGTAGMVSSMWNTVSARFAGSAREIGT